MQLTIYKTVTARMMIKRIFLLISIFLTLFNCVKKQSELEFEKSVAYEIFPAIMDSLHSDFRIAPPPPPKPINKDSLPSDSLIAPPPPPKPLSNEKEKIIGTDTTGFGKGLAVNKKNIEELESDSVKLVVAVRDFAYSLEKKEKNQLLKHFSEQNLKLDNSDLSTEYKIELNKFNTDKKYNYKYLSGFPKGKYIWETDYNFHLSATSYLTRIQFDTTKSFGILKIGMGCGPLCGIGVRVFIRKTNGKWIIDKIVKTEI